MTYIHHWSSTKNSSTKKPLGCAYLFLPQTLSSGSHWFFFFTVSKVVPFSQCGIIGVKCHIAFSDWLILLSNMHLSFLHVLYFYGLITHFFLTLNNIPLSIHHSLFFHSSVEGLGCFQVLAIINKIAINVQFFVCEHKLSTHLCKYQGVWLLSHIKSMFSFVRNFQTVFQSICTIFYSHQQGVRVPIAPYPHWCCLCSGHWSF